MLTSILDNFLASFPLMGVKSYPDKFLVLEGVIGFKASYPGCPEIIDSYEIKIDVPSSFPRDLPIVTETGGKIPKTADFHNAGSLCLGSPLKLLAKLGSNPTIKGYTEDSIIPYLYGISHRVNYGTFPFGELEHGPRGLLDDYCEMLNLTTDAQVKDALRLLSLKKRMANKLPCPCGCGRRLGVCYFNARIRELRHLSDRCWFATQLANINRGTG